MPHEQDSFITVGVCGDEQTQLFSMVSLLLYADTQQKQCDVIVSVVW